MTGTSKATTALCLLVLFAGCGEGDGGSRQEAIARGAAAKDADAVRNALVADRKAVVEANGSATLWKALQKATRTAVK